ncbi:microtubule-associated protein tau isoform X2 [Halictus rubicundus]|uniref:microtubule-associated protein tau isoform X2 n=1 Tax=Halictus rubicundus TaxID=77578 RepID=UPI004035E675
MASQETANNAAESATDRKENLVKPNATLPPGFRARPQGPPGSPRNPLNNGPIGQPRPGLGQPPQIRFDNRAPLRPSGSGQFVQLRPHGQPRPPGNQLPQRPPQQGQNPFQHGQYTPQQHQNPFQQGQNQFQHIQNPAQQGQNPPIVLNPRFAPSPINRTGPQQRPRLPHPGHFQGQFPRNAHPPQHPGFEHPQRSPDVLGRPQEIARRPLQRNESLLSFPQQSSPAQREDRKPPLPRIVVERMADVDSARKQQQLDNSISKEKLRENTENDDDDDVVMDGKKSPRPDSNESIVQSAKRPETATINGKADAKLASKPTEEEPLNDKTNNITADKPDKVESQTVKSAGSESRLPSAKLDQPRTDGADAKTSVEDKPKASNEEQHVPEKTETKKEDLSASEKRTIASPTPSVTEDRPKSAKDSSSELKPSEQELNVASPDKSRSSTPVETSQKDQGLKTPSKTPDKSRSTTPSESNENQKDHGLKTPTRSSETSRSNTPAGSNQVECEQNLKTPSKSPDKSRASTPADSGQSQHEDESKNKAPDESRSPTPAEINQAKDNAESKPSESKSAEANDSRQKSKVTDEMVDKQENASAVAAESEAETSEKQEPAKDPSIEKQSAPSESASDEPKSAGSTKSDSAKTSEDNSSENLQKPAQESTPTSPNVSLPASAKETRTPAKSPMPPEGKLSAAESMLSPPKTPEDSVKGFDNGQRRSLSPKSPTLSSSKSPVSPKSPTGSAKSVGSEKKRASFVESMAEQEVNASDAKTPSKPSTPKIQRAPTPAKLDETLETKTATGIENGNGIDESSVSNSIPATNGVEDSPTKKSPSKIKDADKRSTAGSPVKSPNKSIKSLPRTPDTPSSTAGQEKKIPMNKVQVGAAPSPNLKTVRSKIGSLENTSYKPGGGKVKIENRKLDFSKAQPKIAAKNEKYTPSGGDKKISQVKLQWNAKSKIGSLDNATYKPGGGDKKIETVKLDFKDKAKPKVGSKDNAKHTPGGGNVKSSATPPKTPQDTNNDIQTLKVDIKAESKIGSLDNVKHKPGGGEKKIFNDRDYLRQSGSNVESQNASGSQIENVEEVNSVSTELLKENLPQPPPTTPTKIRKLPSPSSMVTPKAVRSSFAKSSEAAESKKNPSPKETVKVASETRKNLKLANIKAVADEKIAKSPSPEHPVNPRLKSPDKSSPNTPRKASPINIRLPKLAPSPTPPEAIPISEIHSKISLPKLIEPSKHLNSVTH